jgi:hypothetical protein
MGMLRICGFRGCATLTLGEFCAAHEEAVPAREWPRGRPFRSEAESVRPGIAERTAVAAPPAWAVSEAC